MAVDTSEEYLDDLLQAIEPVINPEQYKKSEKKEATTVESAEAVIEESSTEAEEVKIEEPSTEAEEVIIEEASNETEKVTNEEVSTETEEDTNEEASTEAEEVIIEEASTEAEKVKIEEASTEAEETVIEESSNEAEEADVNEAVEEKMPETALNMSDFDFVDTAEEKNDTEELEELVMSADEIEELLNSAKSQAVSEESTGEEELTEDVSQLLKQFSEDEDLSDIQNILEKDELGEVLEPSLLDEAVSAEEVAGLLTSDESEETNSTGHKKHHKKAKKKSLFSFLKKKKKNTAENDENTEQESDTAEDGNIDVNDMNILLSGVEGDDSSQTSEMTLETDAVEALIKEKEPKVEKKKSLFRKIFDLLTEEIEDEETAVPEASETGITDENKEILEELSKEDKKKKKKFGSKKKKGKEAEDSDSEDGEEGEESKGKGKKKKPKKEKKAKKEKVDQLLEKQKPEKKLPRKRVISIFALCFSILAFILIMLAVIPGITNAKQAKWAFDNEDYQTCYENLYGIDRNEKEEILYQKSVMILSVDRQAKSYLNLTKLGMKVEALDALFEGMRAYEEVKERADELAILSRIEPYHEAFLEKLADYHLSEAEIDEILNYESKVAYTMRLESIVNGTEFQWQGLGEESDR